MWIPGFEGDKSKNRKKVGNAEMLPPLCDQPHQQSIFSTMKMNSTQTSEIVKKRKFCCSYLVSTCLSVPSVTGNEWDDIHLLILSHLICCPVVFQTPPN